MSGPEALSWMQVGEVIVVNTCSSECCHTGTVLLQFVGFGCGVGVIGCALTVCRVSFWGDEKNLHVDHVD